MKTLLSFCKFARLSINLLNMQSCSQSLDKSQINFHNSDNSGKIDFNRYHYTGNFSVFRFILSIALLLLGFSQLCFAQSHIFSRYSGGESNLNASQKEKLAAIHAKGIYTSVALVTYDSEAVFDSNGILTLNVDHPIKGLPFKSYYVDYQNPDNYTWIGQFFDYSPSARSEISSMTITRLNGDMIAKIQTDLGSFITYNLGEGIHALAEFDQSNYGEGGLCSTRDNGTVIPISSDTKVCSEDRLTILVAYTQNGANYIYPHNITTFAQSNVNILRGTFLLSGVNQSHLPVLAHAQVVPALVESPESLTVTDPEHWSAYDLIRFSNDPNLISLRASKQADLVAVITRPYKNIDNKDWVGGQAKEIPASFDNGYSLVTATRAMDDTYSFVHEICHLLGARHEEEANPTPGRAHAYKITTGFFNNRIRRSVVHSNLEVVVQYLSNPQVILLNKPLGDYVTANNSAEVDAYLPTAKAFFSDYATFTPQITMVQPEVCKQTGTATVTVPKNCSGPFTYQWSYSDNGGTTWINIPSSNVTTINTFVPLPSPSAPQFLQYYNTRSYRVTVTGPLGTVTSTGIAKYNCLEKAVINELRTAQPQIRATASVRPIPATNTFTVNLNLPEDDDLEIRLLDMSGRQMAVLYKGIVSAGMQQLKFENKYVAGNYLVTVKGKNIAESIKIIIR